MSENENGGIVQQLQEGLSNYITNTVGAIKRQLLTASTAGRLSIEYDFGQSTDTRVIDAIVQNLRDDDLIVEYVAPTTYDGEISPDRPYGAQKLYPYKITITWEHPGF